MKRWTALILLPWIVWKTTDTYGTGQDVTYVHEFHEYRAIHQLPGQDAVEVPCGNDEESCADFVEAMNSAHRFREAAHHVEPKDLYWKRPATLPDVPTVPPSEQEQQ